MRFISSLHLLASMCVQAWSNFYDNIKKNKHWCKLHFQPPPYQMILTHKSTFNDDETRWAWKLLFSSSLFAYYFYPDLLLPLNRKNHALRVCESAKKEKNLCSRKKVMSISRTRRQKMYNEDNIQLCDETYRNETTHFVLGCRCLWTFRNFFQERWKRWWWDIEFW